MGRYERPAANPLQEYQPAKGEWNAESVEVAGSGNSRGCIGFECRFLVAQQKAPTGSVPEESYKYDTPGVQLEGTLIERKVYGPPGYGETPAKDLRTSILVLKLRQQITVEPVPPVAKDNLNADTFKHVREVQLFVNHLK